MSKMACPGQDMRFWGPDDIFEVECGHCGHCLEFFRDDASRRCPQCGERVINPKLAFGCAQWCEYAEKCLCLVNCGRKEPGYDGFEGMLLGWNNRLGDIQVAILKAQLERLEEVTGRRYAMLAQFRQILHERITGIRVLDMDERITRQACYQVVMRYDSREFKGVHRDRFLEALAAEGVELDGSFYVPIPQSTLFDARSDEWPLLRERYGESVFGADVPCPVSEKAAYEEAIWMHYPYLSGSRRDIEDVVEAMAKVQEHAEELK